MEAKENEIRARERQVERTKTSIVFDRTLMDEEQRLAERARKLRSKKVAVHGFC